MPSRFYFIGGGSGYIPPSFQGGWFTITNIGDDCIIETDKNLVSDKLISITNTVAFPTPAAPPKSACIFRGVSRKLSPQTISGTVDFAISVFQNSGTAYTRLYIYVVNATANTVHGVLLNHTEGAASGSTQWPLGSNNNWKTIQLQAPQTLSSVTIPSDSNTYRLVLEFGFSSENISGGASIGATAKFGTRNVDDTFAPDAVVGETGIPPRTKASYITFSGDILLTGAYPRTNRSPETATVIASFPFENTYVFSSDNEELWFKYVATGDMVLGLLACDSIDQDNPYCDVHTTLTGDPPLTWSTEVYSSIPHQFPIKTGIVYYFTLYTDAAGSVLFSILKAPTDAIQAGDLLINADDHLPNIYNTAINGKYPTTWFKPLDGEVRHSSAIFPACELGVSLKNAKFALSAGKPFNAVWIYEAAPSVALIVQVSALADVYSMGTDFTSFYVATQVSSGTPIVVQKISETGVIDTKTWTLPIVNIGYNVSGNGCMGVSRNGTILYYGESVLNGLVRRHDLVNDVALSSFALPTLPNPESDYLPSDLIVLRDGTIAVVFHTGFPYNDVIIHYAADGTVLNVVNFGNEQVHHICHTSGDSSTHIWAWISIGISDGSGVSRNQLRRVRLSDGVVDTSWTKHVFKDGWGPFDFTNSCQPERFGAPDSCPLMVMMFPEGTGPPEVDLSGIYFINPEKTRDTYYTLDRKIPDPTIRTALIGE